MSDESIFAAALAIADHGERAAFLDRVCAGKPALRIDIDELLQAHAASSPLDQLDQATTRATFPAGAAQGTPGVVGDRIGPYRLIEPIGEGGMGTVWMAQQVEPVRRAVAIKLIKSGMDSKTVLVRFEAERQALAIMDHPNIAKVLDAGAMPDGRPFFVMELVKGVPITRFCDERRWTPRQRLELFLPVCNAIQHAHQKGVIHRDIKPSNVLVALYDDRPVPKVIDFGVAKATGISLTDQTLMTGFGAVVGTPEYMSPEQASFNQLDIDTRSDVYALGVLLYELLTGAPPFSKKELEKAGALEIMRVIREVEPPRPSMKLSTAEGLPSIAASRGMEPKKLAGLVRGELDWIVMKALEKDRIRRYESANGFATDVQRYLAGEAVQAHPPSAGYRLRKFVRRNKGPVAAAALILLVLIAGIVGTTWAMFQAKSARDRALHEEAKAVAERNEKEKARAGEEKQRIEVEARLASQIIDLELKDIDYSQKDGGVVQLANILSKLPVSAREARHFIALMVLWRGQEIASFFPRSPSGFDELELFLPDQAAFVCGGREGYRLFDGASGGMLREVRWPGGAMPPNWAISISKDGKALYWNHYGANEFRAMHFDLATGLKSGEFSKPHIPGATWNPNTPILLDNGNWLTFTDVNGQTEWSPDARVFLTESSLWRGQVGQNRLLLSARTQLHDARNGQVIAQFPGYQITSEFTNDGQYLLLLATEIKGVGEREWIVVAARDGRIVHRQKCLGARFTSSGRNLVIETPNELIWRSVADWQLAGSVRMPASHRVVTHSFDTWAAIGIYGNAEAPNARVQIVRRQDGESRDFDVGIVAADDERALLGNGTVVEINPLRILQRPPDHRFHPDARRLSADGRLLWLAKPLFEPSVDGLQQANDQCELFDLVMDKAVFTYAEGGQDCRLSRAGTALLVAKTPLARSTLLPTADVELDAVVLQLWARVVACGDLNAAGKFAFWDEATWREKQRELARLAPPVDGFPFPGRVANDNLHWLHTHILSLDFNPALLPISLLDQLVAAARTPANLAQRASAHCYRRNFDEALNDWEEVAKLQPNQNLPDGWAWPLVSVPDLPRNLYERVDRLFAMQPIANSDNEGVLRLLSLYRVDKHREVLELAARFEAKRLRGPLLAFAGVGWLPMLLNGLLSENDPRSYRDDYLLVVAMSHFRLGDRDLARAAVERFESLRKSGFDVLFKEATRLIGYVPEKKK